MNEFWVIMLDEKFLTISDSNLVDMVDEIESAFQFDSLNSAGNYLSDNLDTYLDYRIMRIELSTSEIIFI